MNVMVKTSYDSTRLENELRQTAEDQNPNVAVGRVQPLEQVVSGSISDLRSTIRIFIGFAGTAMLLAAIGIYGLMSYWVTQRIYEIGVRLAIGATRPQIVSTVLQQGLCISVYGISAGVVAALFLTRFLRSPLYGIGVSDPATFVIFTVLVLAVAIAATAFSACRAARIDPAKSLRVD